MHDLTLVGFRLIDPSVPMTRKRQLAAQLQKLEIYQTSNLTSDFFVALKDGTVARGRPAPCTVLLTCSDEVIQIYLAEGYLEKERFPQHLIRSLAFYCEIPAERVLLLGTALLSDYETIQDDFSRCGVPQLDSKVFSDEPIEDEYELKAGKSI